MHKAVPIFALIALLAGCGGDKPDATPTPVATATATTAATAGDPLAGYSDGVRKHYSGADPSAVDDPNADAEVRYFQPPRPAEAKVGETIILTGSNIGVEVAATVTGVDTVNVDGKDYTAVELELDNGVDGITVLDSELTSATLTFAGGEPVPVAKRSVEAPCSNGFNASPRLDVGDKKQGCVLFPGDGQPERFQLALETIPADAGGIWNLTSR